MAGGAMTVPRMAKTRRGLRTSCRRRPSRSLEPDAPYTTTSQCSGLVRRGVIPWRGTSTRVMPSSRAVTDCWIRRPEARNSARGSSIRVPRTRKSTATPAWVMCTLTTSAPGRASAVTTRALPVTERPIRWRRPVTPDAVIGFVGPS